MLPFRRRIRRVFYYLLAVTVLGLGRLMPRRMGLSCCRALACVAVAWRPRERKQAERNLTAALPSLSHSERRLLIGRITDALGSGLYETLVLERTAARDFPDVADDGAIDAIRSLQSEGRGVLLLTGHIGCWELLGAYLAARLGELAVVTGTVHNAPVDRLIQRRRARLGMTPLPREGDLRPLLSTLRRGGVVAVLMDQNTRVHNVPVPFFGIPAPTAVGFAQLALRYDVPVLPVAIHRFNGRHRVTHLAPIRPPAKRQPDPVLPFLERCNAALETLIRRNLAEWVWFHKRWPDKELEQAGIGQESGAC